MSTSVERRLAAVLAMDTVAYSRLMGSDEVGTLNALKRHRAALIDPAVAAHNGRLVKTTGDGLLLEFASVVDAIACAVAIQRGMLTRNEDVPADKRIVFRVGINIGDIIIEGDDIFGDGVNVAARLEALCEPGGVCISRSANEQVRDKLSLSFADLGEHTVKNIARAVGVFGLAAKDIAALPEIPVAAPETATEASAPRRLPRAAIAAVAAAAVLAGAAAWWFARDRPAAPAPLEARLAAAMARALPGASAKHREEVVAAYARLAPNRAVAVAQKGSGSVRTGDWPSPEIAEEKALEKCQAFHDEPCVILAVNDTVASPAADGSLPVRDAARVRYSGLYNPERIPGLRPKDLRPEVLAYATAAGPRAAAVHAFGAVHVVTGAASQRAAEERALAACNNDPVRRDSTRPCLLYAVENRVVLPLRASTPLTAAAPTPAAAAAPPPPPAAAANAGLRAALLDRLAKAAPTQQASVREAQADAYLGAPPQKAIAAFPPSTTWRTHNWSTAAAAEEHTLEACQARFGEPCALVALNDTLQPAPADGNWPRRPMPRVAYDGPFDPQQIPAANAPLRQRADVAAYRDKAGPKAAAYHPWGRLFIAGAASQRAAEEQALAACNADPQRNGQNGPCLLYAVDNQVVLTKRSLLPLTPN